MGGVDILQEEYITGGKLPRCCDPQLTLARDYHHAKLHTIKLSVFKPGFRFEVFTPNVHKPSCANTISSATGASHLPPRHAHLPSSRQPYLTAFGFLSLNQFRYVKKSPVLRD